MSLNASHRNVFTCLNLILDELYKLKKRNTLVMVKLLSFKKLSRLLYVSRMHLQLGFFFKMYSELASFFHCSTMINENRTSLLRSGTSNKKPTTEKDLVMELWQNYVILACAVAQKGIPPQFRCASPDPGSVLKK